MHDIRAIRQNPDDFDKALSKRGLPPKAQAILKIDADRRAKIGAAEAALAERNAASKRVGEAKASGNQEEFERLRALVAQKKDEIARLEEEAENEKAHLNDILLSLPNLPSEEVPHGADESDNILLKESGTPKRFEFTPKEHFELPAVKKRMDFERAAKLSGSRFVVLSGAIARIHRALAQFMIDLHVTAHGLTEVNTPVLVRDEAMRGTGQLPKFAEDSYQTTNGWWLIPTSEVTLTNLVAGEILEDHELPQRFTAHSLCFRSEAGSAGRDTAGMLRQHQFEKVEMVSLTRPEDGKSELERMTACAEAVLKQLELPYRVMVLCSGDLGFSAHLTYDIEVWLPGQNTYREISSCSLCGTFQARRMNARYRPGAGEKPAFVASLNGSGLAVGRALIAVLENGQEADGSVTLPGVLSPYLGGKTRLNLDGALI